MARRRLILLVPLLLLGCSLPAGADHQRPSIDVLRGLFPRYSQELAYIDDSVTAREMPTGWKPPGLRELWKDIDGDGREEYTFISEWFQSGKNIHSGYPYRLRQLLLGIVRRSDDGWSVVDYRQSADKNIVADAYLIDVKGGVEVLVHERRGQCDDEKIERYALVWDPAKGTMQGPFEDKHLHPFPRDWNCGE